jgi:hypothetical protein
LDRDFWYPSEIIKEKVEPDASSALFGISPSSLSLPTSKKGVLALSPYWLEDYNDPLKVNCISLSYTLDKRYPLFS